MPDLVFEVNDKDGISVRLLTGRWQMHMIVKHPEVAPYLEAIQRVIQAPAIITQDEGQAHHLSCLGAAEGKWRNLYLEVVVRYHESSAQKSGEVLTAFFNARPPKGELQWLAKK